MLPEMLAEASAMALMAVAFSFMLRSTGVLILEVTVFGLGGALGLVALVGNQSAAAPSPVRFLICGIVAFFLGIALLKFYRLCRASRGGDATTLVMSFALMTCLSLITSRLTEGKSVMVSPKIASHPAAVALVGWLLLLIIMVIWRNPRIKATLSLARENDALLTTFSIAGESVRLATVVLSCGVLGIGTVIYVSQQDNFAAIRYESFLVPVFAIVISQSTPRIGRIVALSLCFVVFEHVLRLKGEPVLLRAYQSGVLVLLVLFMPLLSSVGKLNRLPARLLAALAQSRVKP